MAGTYDIEVHQGGSFSLQLQYLTDAEPVNISGYAIKGQIRAAYTSPTASAEFTSSVLDASQGLFTLTLHPSSSALLTGSCYYYDIRLTTGSTVIYLVNGEVTVVPRVTS